MNFRNTEKDMVEVIDLVKTTGKSSTPFCM